MPYIPRSDVTRATSRAAPFVFTSARDLSCVVYPKYARRLSTITPRIARLTLDMLLLREMEFIVHFAEFDGKYPGKRNII